MKKRILACLVAGLLVLASIAGCANSGTSSNGSPSTSPSKQDNTAAGNAEAAADDNINLDGTMPIIKDPSKFEKMNMMLISPPTRVVPAGEMEMIKKLRDITGVEFEWTEIPSDGAGEKINLLLASGSGLPDAFWNGISGSMVAQFMDQDVFIPTEDLVDTYMHRLKAVYDSHPHYRSSATAPNGHMYGFPYIEEMRGLVLTPGPFLVNTQWLEKVGKSMPTTVDEFADVLRAFRDAGDLNGNGQADEIPYALDFTARDFSGSYASFFHFTGAFGQAIPYCDWNGPADYMRLINDEIVYAGLDESLKETAKWFHTLYNEKLLDVDSFSPGPSGPHGDPIYLNKIKGAEAVVGAMGLWAPANQIPNPDVRREYQSIPRMTGPGGKTGVALNFSELQDTSMVAITTECKYPEVIAAFVDYCFEPEISITLNWGAEGYIYEKGDDGILHFRLDENDDILLVDPFQTFGEMRDNTTPARGAMAVLNEYYDTVADYTWDAKDLLEGQIAMGKNEILAEYTSIPKMLMTTEEQTRISQIQPTLTDILRRYVIQWVIDGNADATWDAYQAEMKAAGVDDLVAVFQGAYERFLSAS